MSKQTNNKGMNEMNRQAVLDVLNNLPVFESQGGDDAYMLVEFTDEVVKKLQSVGIMKETAERYGDKETFCVAALALSEGFANDYADGKFIYDELIGVTGRVTKSIKVTKVKRHEHGMDVRVIDQDGNQYWTDIENIDLD